MIVKIGKTAIPVYILGIATGIVFLLVTALVPLSPSHPILSRLGIKKAHVIGFQPYWLLGRAKKNYNIYITEITYFGLTLNSDGTIVKLVSPQEEEPGWTTLKSDRVTKLLKQSENKRVKTSLLIHNGNEASVAALLKKPVAHAKNLVENIKPIMRQYRFTDLNLDIESFNKATNNMQQQFISFVKEVHNRLQEENLGTLTIEITPISLVKTQLIDPTQISKISDYVVLLAYDFHFLGSFLSGPIAPLSGAGKDKEYDVETSIDEALKLIPADKLVLGIPLYGYEWETISSFPGIPVIPNSGSVASHQRITDFLSNCKHCVTTKGESSKEPYVIFPDDEGEYYHQIFFEDEQSLTKKLQLARDKKIAGVALWALGYEGDHILEPLRPYKASFEFLY